MNSSSLLGFVLWCITLPIVIFPSPQRVVEFTDIKCVPLKHSVFNYTNNR